MTNGSQSNPGAENLTVREIENFCREMVGHMGLEISVQGGERPDSIVLNLSGPDRPVLLSNAASVLNGMEYLINKAFRTGKGEKISSILLDSDSYRQHREAELLLLAQMASKKVIAQKKALSLQPMIPRERRIIHLALAEIEGVRSESEGEGDSRSITIYPVE